MPIIKEGTLFFVLLIHHLMFPGWAQSKQLPLALSYNASSFHCLLMHDLMTMKNNVSFCVLSFDLTPSVLYIHSTFLLKHAAMLSIIARNMKVQRESAMWISGHKLIMIISLQFTVTS